MKNTLPILLSLFTLYTLQSKPIDIPETQTVYLSGTGSDDTVEWEFKVNGGRRSGEWSTIPVPSNWEMQGFGTYHYWKDWGEEEEEASDTIAQYRHCFDVPSEWNGNQVEIVFGAAMTDCEVFINGQSAGPKHQGGFYQFSYDITDLLLTGESNLLEVTVHKFSENLSVNEAEREADYWLFGGIYRPVWLNISPPSSIQRMAVDAKADGTFSVDAFMKGIDSGFSIVASVYNQQGKQLGSSDPVLLTADQKKASLTGQIDGIKPWSAEWPNLYRLELILQDENAAVLHRFNETIGFRTLELRESDGFYVNGEKVILKGSNRHSFWPTTGRATNKSLSVADVLLMKEMNMNAVRMSHYPPDPHFLDACDRLGLYVLDELGGWQKAYDSEVGPKLVKETVIRDVNHPSIIFWDNGNEGGWNTDLDDDFALWDPQQRTVLHPWNLFNGINTTHYEDFDSGPNWFFHGEDLIMPTEFLHGLYDGGHGAGLNDWWNRILNHPLGLGGFLWAFADEGIVREDQGGKIDVAGNRAPDGIVGPFREKEASFYTIKEIWAPIYCPRSEVDTLPATFDGSLELENRYDFTNTAQLHFEWNLIQCISDSTPEPMWQTVASGIVVAPSIEPGLKGDLQLTLPDDWARADVLELVIEDPYQREIYRRRWTIRGIEEKVAQWIPETTSNSGNRASSTEHSILLTAGDLRVEIDSQTGLLKQISKSGIVSVLNNGPISVSGESEVQSMEIDPDGVTFHYTGSLRKVRWQIIDENWLKLDYAYHHRGDERYDYFGVTFNYDESTVKGIRWLGKGPYRVWKNREKGVEFGLWEKQFNDTITGMSWQYPEFKGFHEDVIYAQLNDSKLPLTMVIPSPDINLRLFTPTEANEPRKTHVDFPPGDLSFMHAIAPIGTKFKEAWQHGPEGRKSWAHRGGQTFNGTVYFKLGAIDEKE